MSSKDEQDGNNPLVLMNEEDKYARIVGRKGLGSDGEMEWLVRDMSEELKSWGHVGGDSGRFILKSDGEWYIKALKGALGKYHGGIIIPEVSARGESQSNGCCEHGAQVVAEFIRVLKERCDGPQQCALSTWWAKMGKHLTSAGGERNATWLLCLSENVYCTNKLGKARIAGPSSRLRTKKASGWDTIGKPTRRSSEFHTVWSRLTLSAGEMTPHDGARL